MSKIAKLTPEQEALIPEWRERYRAEALRTDSIDEEEARASVKALYESVGLDAPKLILMAESPMQAQMMRGVLSLGESQLWSQLRGQLESQLWIQLESQLRGQLESQLRSQLESQLWIQLESQLRSHLWSQLESQLWIQLESQLWSQLESRLWSQLRGQLESQLWIQLESQLWSQLRSHLWSQLESQLWIQLRGQLRSQLWSQLRSQLRGQLRSQLWSQLRSQLKNFDGLWFIGAWDGCWLSFYSFAKHIGVKLTEKENSWLEAYNNYARSCGVSFLYDGVAIICDRPSVIKFDDNSRLHSDDGPALQWRDGYSLHAWHGTQLPSEWFSDGAPAPQTVLAHENTEQRAAGLQYVGLDKVLDHLEHRLIDSDPNPERGDLIALKLPGLRTEGVYLKAHCPRNGTIMEAVPPVSDIDGKPIKTVLAAQAWRVRMRPEEFQYPTLRT